LDKKVWKKFGQDAVVKFAPRLESNGVGKLLFEPVLSETMAVPVGCAPAIVAIATLVVEVEADALVVAVGMLTVVLEFRWRLCSSRIFGGGLRSTRISPERARSSSVNCINLSTSFCPCNAVTVQLHARTSSSVIR
jgi:hypothetical protein